ncbi:MAG: CDP-diacylglycerol--glycerol-3-phosphate 3-phosphatidyltransferase [Opitutaceae bacterium]
MNTPNIITLSRIPLMFVIVGLMYCDFTGAPSLAFWLFIIAAVGDWYDGYLARKMKIVSTFGKLMDALTDKIMVLGLVVAFVHQHTIPVVLALITLCREFLITGMRMVASARGVIVPADGGGKAKTMTQLIALGFLIGEPMVRIDWARFLPWDLTGFTKLVHQIGYFGFVLGTVLAVWSGSRYVWRNKNVVFSEAD